MKKYPVLIIFILTAVLAHAQLETVTIESIPADIDEFTALRDEIAVTPEGGAAMFVVAMLIYNQDRGLGLDCFTVIFANDETILRKDPDGYKGYSPDLSSMYLIERLNDKPWITNSYVFGTSPASMYQLKALPYAFKFNRNEYSEIKSDIIKVFIYSSGASTPRPVTLLKNNRGIWKVKEFSSLVVGVMEGKIINDDL